MPMPVQEDETGCLNWRKSVRSVNNGACTEVASSVGVIMVRDSQDPDTLVLRYSASSWRAFLHAARTGTLDSLG
jgi:hypothetical protein